MATDEEIEAAKKRADAAELKRKQAAEDLVIVRQKEFEKIKAQRDAAKDMFNIYASIESLARNNLKMQELRVKEAQKALELLEAQLDAGHIQLEQYKKASEQLNEHIKRGGRIIDAKKRLNNVSGLYLKTVTGIGEQWKETVLGSIIEAKAAGVSFSDMMLDAGAGFKNMAANFAPSMLMKVAESTIKVALAQDAATAEFAKATGTGDKYFDTITSIANSNRAFGLSAQDSAQAIMSLRENMSTFTMQSMESQKEIATFASQLEAAYGVGEEFAVGMEMMTKGMGLNIEQSKDFTSNILGNAEALGINSKAAMQMFTVAGPRMAMYGKNGTKVFKGLMEQTKKTGLAMQTLLGITEQFDTFEGASDMVANFNHLLGGPYLNTMEMMMATDEERIKLLQDHFKASGKSFDQMDQHTKLAIAKQMGFKDVNEAAMALNPNMIGLTESQREARLEQKALAEQAQKAQPAMKQLENLMNSMAIAIQPIVKAFNFLINGIVALNDVTGGWAIPIITIFIGLFWAWLKIKKSAAKATLDSINTILKEISANTAATTTKEVDIGITKTHTQVIRENTTAINRNNNAKQRGSGNIKDMGKAAGGAWKSMLAFGGAVLMIGAGIYIAARGMTEFVKAFHGMTPEQIDAVTKAIAVFMGIMLGFIVALSIIAIAASGAAVPLLIFGAAVLMIGAGIGIAAGGMSLLVSSIGETFKIIKGNMKEFMLFVAGLTMLSVISPGLVFTFGVLVPGLALLAGVLFLTPGEKLKSLAILFESISKVSTGTAGAISSIAAAIKQVVDAVNSLDWKSAGALGAIMGMNLAAEAVGAGASGLPGRASNAATNRAPQNAQNVNSGGGGGPVVVKLHLDDKVLGEFVIKHANKETRNMIEKAGKGRLS